jgi:hypothetical protein
MSPCHLRDSHLVRSRTVSDKECRWTDGDGKVTVKTRRGLITFGPGLDDAELRYLHSVVRRALVE